MEGDRFDPNHLARVSAELEQADPNAILDWALSTYLPRLAISTAFGVEGCALIHMALRIQPNIPVFSVDTDFLFPETLELLDRFVREYGINLVRYKGQVTLEEQEKRHGLKLYERDPDLCCALRKVEPTKRAVEGLDCWIAGLRRDQGPSRAGIAIVERYEHADGSPLIKVNPLANWRREDTWRYVLDNKVPYNPLLDQGYKSIGCWPCTRRVEAGGDERSGRWADKDKTECGIHTFMERKE